MSESTGKQREEGIKIGYGRVKIRVFRKFEQK